MRKLLTPLICSVMIFALPPIFADAWGADSENPAPVPLISASPASPIPDDSGLIKELEYKLKVNATFINAAKKILEGVDNKEAQGYFKIAESFSMEANRLYGKKEYRLALEKVLKSNRMAIDSVIITKNGQSSTFRDKTVQQEMESRKKSDIEHKKAMIEKGMPEAEVFVKKAERLLADHEVKQARVDLDKARELFRSAKAAQEKGEYDKALEDINGAYTLATGAVKEIKRDSGEVIAVRRPSSNSEDELLAYELRKNDAYVFLASHSVNFADSEAKGLLESARSVKKEAMESIGAGDNQKAIKRLRESTEFFMKAIRQSR